MQSFIVKYNTHDGGQFYKCQNGIQQHETFIDHHDSHCVKLSPSTIRFFYIGTSSLMITAALLFHSRFKILFNAPAASYIFSTIIGITLFLIAMLKLCVSTNTRVSLQERDMYLNG